MRLIFACCFSLAISFSFAQSNAALKLIDATSQKWIGGNPSSGSGEKYTMLLQLKTTQKVAITKVWINKNEVYFELQNYRMLLDRAATKGDTIAILYNPRYHNEKPELKPAESKKNCKSKAQAMIEYNILEKRKYLRVKSFRVLDETRHQ
jgi:hypothetical protein